jgi:hypothetical protein
LHELRVFRAKRHNIGTNGAEPYPAHRGSRSRGTGDQIAGPCDWHLARLCEKGSIPDRILDGQAPSRERVRLSIQLLRSSKCQRVGSLLQSAVQSKQAPNIDRKDGKAEKDRQHKCNVDKDKAILVQAEASLETP